MSTYTIEPHGPKGTYALYQGRSNEMHGARLLNLNDGDAAMSEHLTLIETALNSFSDLQNFAQDSDEAVKALSLNVEQLEKEIVELKEKLALLWEIQSLPKTEKADHPSATG